MQEQFENFIKRIAKKPKTSDSIGLGVFHRNRKMIGNISAEFSLKVSNHKVGDVLLKHRVGVSRL
jgi:hypothetical protein